MSGERKAPAAQDGDDEMSVVQDAAAENAVEKPLLQCKGLNFKYSLKGKLVLKDINVSIGKGQRVLLLGGNGAGKSTLLKIFAGKHLIQDAEIFSVLGTRAPQAQFNGLAFLGDFARRTVAFAASNVAYECDIPVRDMQKKLQRENPERAAKLINLLGINLDWRMHQVSDGQRRRVQVFLSLLQPPSLILMDEVTTSLDLVCKQDMLNYLKQESEERGVSIIFATHILDGLDEWATDLMYLNNGGVCPTGVERLADIAEWKERTARGDANPLLKTVETRMRKEREKDATLATSEPAAFAVKKSKHDHNQGGYSSGRLSGFSANRFDGYR